MSDMFEHWVQARNPVMYVGLALGLAAMRATIVHGDIPLASIAAAAFVATILWRLILNPKAGFRLNGRMVELFDPVSRRVVPLRQIDSVMISGRARRGETLCLLRLTDGTELAVPATTRCDARTLAGIFAERGLRVLI